MKRKMKENQEDEKESEGKLNRMKKNMKENEKDAKENEGKSRG